MQKRLKLEHGHTQGDEGYPALVEPLARMHVCPVLRSGPVDWKALPIACAVDVGAFPQRLCGTGCSGIWGCEGWDSSFQIPSSSAPQRVIFPCPLVTWNKSFLVFSQSL